MSQEDLSEELTAFEAALSSLGPKASSLDRDRVMFLAGQAAGKSSLPAGRLRASWLWPCVTAASLLAAVTFGGMLLVRGGPQIADLGPQDESIAVARGYDSFQGKKPRTDYLKLRQLVLAEGVEALPAPAPVFAPHGKVPMWGIGSRSNLEELLGG